jgi:hypothetical protein
VSMKPYTNHVVASRGTEIQATRRPEQTAVGAAVCSPVSPRHGCFGRISTAPVKDGQTTVGAKEASR